MADSSRNPGDNARLSRLQRELEEAGADFKALGAEAKEVAAAQEQTARRLDENAAEVRKERRQGESARKRQPKGGPEPTPATAKDVARAQEENAAAAERKASAETRSQRALEAQARTHRDIMRMGPPTGGVGPYNVRGGVGGIPTYQYRQPIGPGRGIPFPIGGGPLQLNPGPARVFAMGPTGSTLSSAVGYNRYGGIGPIDEPAAKTPRAASLTNVLGNRKEMAVASENAAVAEMRFSESLHQSAVAMGLNAQQMGRHGALTTEFIAAAARGEVTVRDLGNQIGLTIGKFAGWTLAATAVYGVVGALGAVGRGAISAASGVDLVSRSIPEASQHADELQARFAELSHEFNLPIEDVTQAVYGMGKVFGSQGGLPAALKASEQALFAVKVGELDAATATRYLTGIVGGFKLSAGELPAVFDAIDQAQNKFGGNTGQIIAGVAKASGQFRLVGGDYRELIALITTASRITGTTGENVGTAIGRSAASSLTPQGQARLRAVGLNPDQEYMSLLAEAAKKSQGQSRERVQDIARALVPAGGQFARVFVPLLQNRELYNKVFASISPENARGAAGRELATALRQPNEQLKRLVTNMEQLGVQLSRAGALDPFILLLQGLNGTIHGVERLLDLFNELPAPLRHSLAILLELAAVMKVARRFDAGALIPGSLGRSLAASPEQRARREALIALEEQRTAFTGLRQDAARNVFRANAAGDAEAANLALAERQRYDAELLRIDQQRAVISRRIMGQAAADLAAQEVIANSGGIAPVGGGPGRIQYTRPAGPAEAPRGFAALNASLQARAAESQLLARTGQATGLTGRVTGVALTGAAASMRYAGSAITGVAGAMKGMATGLAAMLGPLDVLIAAAVLFPSVYSHYKDRLDELDKLSRDDLGGNPDALRAKAAELSHRSAFQKFLNTEQLGAEKLFNFVLPGDPAYAPGRNQDATANELRARANEIAALNKRRQYLTLPAIRDTLHAGLLRNQGDPAEQQRLTAQAMKEVRQGRALNSPNATPQQRDEARQMLRNLADDYAVLASMRNDVRQALASIKDATSLGTFIDERNAHLLGTPQGTRQHDALAIGRTIVRAREQVGEGTSTLKDALGNIDKANQDVQQFVERDLNRGLASASTASARGRLRSQAIGSLRNNLVVPLRERTAQLRKTLATQNSDIDKLEREIIDQSQETGELEARGLKDPGGHAYIKQLKTRRDKLRKVRDKNTARYKQVTAQLKEEEAILREFEIEQRKSQFDDELEELNSQATLAESRTNNPVEKARIAAANLHKVTQKVRDGFRHHLKTLTDLNNALARENDSLQEVAQQEFQDFQGRQQLGASRFELAHLGDQSAILGHNLAQSRNALRRGQKAGLSPQTIRGLKKDVVDAQIALAQYAKDQADALADAQFDLALSRTDDPVKQARIRLRQAYDHLTRARNPVDRTKAQAEVNNARRDTRNARYQDRFDTIEFEAEMGRITRETEISRLKSLEKVIKGNRDFRRQIQLRIHQLQQESDSNAVELNIGDIRLPTLYDVRRLARQGTQNQMNVRQNFVINVDGSGDPEAVADSVFSRFAQESGSGLRSAARSQGG